MKTSNILDPIHDTLSPAVWNDPGASEPVLKPVHSHFVTKTIYAILEHGGYPKPHEWLKLYFTGSLCTYQYGPNSDADISLFVQSDKLPEWSRAEMIGLMIEGCDGVTLPGTPHELQGYVVARGLHPTDLYKSGLRAGYSIDDHRWVVPPDHSLAHNVQAQENGFYVWAMQKADVMDRLLRYEPDKAVDMWHQIHRRRMRDQQAGKGDSSESNIIYKFLAHRGLLPQIAEVSGEHIAFTPRHAGMTLPQEKRQWQTLQKTYPNSSQVVHQFPNGYTIQDHPTRADKWRVGVMLRNCWQPNLPDNYDDEWLKNEGEVPVGGTTGTKTMGLHDEHDIPRAAFFHRPQYESMGFTWPEGIDAVKGHHNRALYPEQLQMMADWAGQQGYSVERKHPQAWLEQQMPWARTDQEYGDWAGMPKTAGWQDHFVDKINPIAQAYGSMPMYDPNAVGAWQELAADSERRANELRQRYNISVTDNPEPYPIDATGHHVMFNDINNGNFTVSRAHSEHPIWTPDQNVNFRIVHDLLGHYPSGGGFDWQGENQACGNHFPLLSSNAQRALMTECLGQTGYAIANGGFGPQKIGFMDHLMGPAQQTFSAVIPEGGFCHRHIRHGIYRL